MSIDFVRPEVDELRPRISVIGVGGAGGNAIANMMRADVQGVDFVVANTDAQALNASDADRRIQSRISVIGVGGAGGNAIANMMRADVQGVDFVVANTDAQALNASDADRRI